MRHELTFLLESVKVHLASATSLNAPVLYRELSVVLNATPANSLVGEHSKAPSFLNMNSGFIKISLILLGNKQFNRSIRGISHCYALIGYMQKIEIHTGNSDGV